MKNPGQRGEQLAEALGTDTKTMRLPMQNSIADEKVRTKGERGGMSTTRCRRELGTPIAPHVPLRVSQVR